MCVYVVLYLFVSVVCITGLYKTTPLPQETEFIRCCKPLQNHATAVLSCFTTYCSTITGTF